MEYTRNNRRARGSLVNRCTELVKVGVESARSWTKSSLVSWDEIGLSKTTRVRELSMLPWER